VVNAAGIWGLGWNMFHWNTMEFAMQNEVMKDEWGSFLYNLSQNAVDIIDVSKSWCVGVSLSTLPPEDNRLVWIPNSIHINLADIKKDLKGRYLTTGNRGNICVATGRDQDLKKAKIRAYSAINNVKISGNPGWFRTDIADRLIDNDLSKLIKWGYISPK
jgi:hypothetical protein